MNFKKILICAFCIAFNIALNAGWVNWVRSFFWTEEAAASISLVSADNKTNYLHSVNETLNTEKLKIDNTRAQAILYIYSILVKNENLKSDLFAIQDVMKVIDNQTVPNIDFAQKIQDAIDAYIKRKLAKNNDATYLLDANNHLRKIESDIVSYLLNIVDANLTNLVVALTILDENIIKE